MTGHEAPHKHSVWLCAEAQTHSALLADITQLTTLSHTPAFEPHVTLLGDLNGDPDQTAEACRRAFKGSGAVHVRVHAVAHSEAYFMSFFLDVEVPDAVQIVRTQIAADLCVTPTMPYRPHISLAYGLGENKVPSDLKARLDREYTDREIILSHAVVVASASDIPIERWQRLVTIKL